VYYGMTGKFIYRKLGGYQAAGGTLQTFTATAGAADLGIFYKMPPEVLKDLSLGISVQNIGSTLTFLGDEADALPLAVRAGLGWRAWDQSWLRAIVLADVIKPVDPDGGKFESGTWGGAGLEVTVRDMLALRFGVRSGLDGTRVVGGAGLLYHGISLDYAFIPLGDSNSVFSPGFSNGHRFGMTVKLGVAQRKKVARKRPVAMAAARPAAAVKAAKASPPAPKKLRVAEAAEVAKPVLPAPKKLRAVPREGRGARLTWDPVERAAGYDIYYRYTGEGRKAWRRATASPVKSTRVTLKGLRLKSYDFTVVTVNSDGKGGKGTRPRKVTVKL